VSGVPPDDAGSSPVLGVQSTPLRPTSGGADPALEVLRAIATRVDEKGQVLLESAEMPFFLSSEGTRWLRQVESGGHTFEITAHGRQALEMVPKP